AVLTPAQHRWATPPRQPPNHRAMIICQTRPRGLFGRIAVDVATDHVVRIPKIESATASHVNSDLGSFNRCVAAVIARFPFYADGDEDRYEAIADDLRDLISGIDETALVHNGFWETFCDDVAIGDYADWDA
ncbi:SUKH-4 family immunity protein, partial [Streptomyces sp. NPDC051569]|uniref:SUKH-4 family immunity protein n=1 Tax=Streptomyces sp. NPDC051569 TaxID=3365661 RepID=UPI0037B9DD63